MEQKSRKVSVRLDEELLKTVTDESGRMGMDRSEYIRLAIKEKAEQDNPILSIDALCKISTIYNRIIDKYGVDEYEKEDMRKELEKLWRR